MIPLIVSSLLPSAIFLGIAPETIEGNSPNKTPSNTDFIEISQLFGNETSSPPPDVIEVYLTDPQDIATENDLTPLPTPDEAADNLGTPISVGTEGNSTQEVNNLDRIEGQPITLEAKRLITRKRGGETQEYSFSDNPLAQNNLPAADTDEELVGVIELIADQQEYDANNQVIMAKGNVVMRFANAVLLADRLRINIPDRLAVAEGEVVLQRGDQTLRGEKFEYYFVQDRGVVFNAYGEIYQKSTTRDFSPTLPTDLSGLSNRSLNERLAVNQPIQGVTPAEGLQLGIGTSLDPASGQPVGSFATPFTGTQQQGGQINRVRFQAEMVEFNAQGWDATDVRLTNDPFSPPELEVRAETATFRPIAPLVDELRLNNSRLVLDQSVTFPTQERLVFDRRDRQPGAFALGFDGEERGGLYIERGFNIIDNDRVRFEINPQYLIQKAFFPDSFPEANPTNDEIGPFTPSVFGLTWDFEADFDQRTRLYNTFSLASLNLEDAEEHLRTKLALQRLLGNLGSPHDLRLEYNYRERLFNGSLGFQTVQSSLGAILVSPSIQIWDTGIFLSYQGSIQYVNADTDRIDLLIEQDKLVDGRLINTRVDLMRYQGAASLNKGFLLWSGIPLPPTPEEGLKYTPRPIVPYLLLGTSVTGVASYYSSGDTQPSISGSVSLLGQFGHFSRPFLDYTGFTVTFSQAARGDASPFFFDRFVDTQTLTLGITQQLYGPVRFGFQTVRNLELNSEISTDYFVEYSRRTYNILVRYNPVLEIGSINLRISDFNWSGDPGPFEGTGVSPVIQGVPR